MQKVYVDWENREILTPEEFESRKLALIEKIKEKATKWETDDDFQNWFNRNFNLSDALRHPLDHFLNLWRQHMMDDCVWYSDLELSTGWFDPEEFDEYEIGA